jgi:predicted aspartyl protease
MKARDDANHRGPAREGSALLQGLVRCGQYGRAMIVNYGGGSATARAQTLQYRCYRAHRMKEEKDCQLVGGRRVDDVVVGAFLDVAKGAGAEAAALASASFQKQNEEAELAWCAQIERAEYEAQRAERQFHAVEVELSRLARPGQRPGRIVRVTFLVDTGADMTVLSQAVVDALGVAPVGDAQIAGVTDTHGVIVPLYSLQLVLAGAPPIEVDACVLSRDDADVQGLLGRDALAHLRLGYDGPRGTFALEPG